MAVAVLVLALVVALAAAGGADASLASRLSNALAASGVPAGSTGAYAADLATGRVVYSSGRARSLRPASNQKLVVALAALDGLGPRARIETEVLGLGRQDGNVWVGSLFLKGQGDPTLSSSRLVRLAERVRALGIRRLTGSVLGDESAFDTRRTGPGWRSSFYKLECPPLSALIVDRGWMGSYSTDDPTLAAAREFRQALRDAGVKVRRRARVGVAPPEPVKLARTRSPRVQKIVRRMNKESDNFYAEMLLKRLGHVESGKTGTTRRGAKAASAVLAEHGVPLAGVRIADGSGLSRLNRLTARALGVLLRKALADDRIARPFYASLPRAGIDGTLEDRMETWPARDRVRAKTGTTDRASALAGYVGAKFVFAVVQNGNPVPWNSTRKSQDRFARILAKKAA